MQLATCPQNLTISLTLTLCAIVDVAPAAANTICFDVAGSLPTPDSISEFFHLLGRYLCEGILGRYLCGRYFHDTRDSLNFITVAKILRYSTSKNVVTLKWGQRSLTVIESGIKTNSNHVLRPYLPDKVNLPYQLRTRSHNMTLINKTKHVNDSDFIVRMLYKYSY